MLKAVEEEGCGLLEEKFGPNRRCSVLGSQVPSKLDGWRGICNEGDLGTVGLGLGNGAVGYLHREVYFSAISAIPACLPLLEEENRPTSLDTKRPVMQGQQYFGAFCGHLCGRKLGVAASLFQPS